MSGNIQARALLGSPRAVVSFLGISAVIVGILAMHVWMGGHGPTARGATPPAPAAVMVTELSGAGESGHAVAPSSASVAGSGSDTGDSTHGCAGTCGDDGMALGLCVLALLVVTALALLLPAGRAVPGAVLLRGPPRIVLRPLAIPTPSLIRLCISRV
ncbi:hypothetical protein [uncultured Arthrobacter sp.]|uniref:hypothetical protein n=1 Tax=uncultured Arthrobacter sp. TaxID=114050 RepID=UPI00261C580D|nr:hypothetical protein [uncultured Arthrobacter sp.]